MRYYLAIDIGASSGRHIVGWQDGDSLRTEEVYRFPNGVQEQNGHLVWDVQTLLSNVVAGIKAAFQAYPTIESLSVDTWGVDYVLLKEDQEIQSMPTEIAAQRPLFRRCIKRFLLRCCISAQVASFSLLTLSISFMLTN